MSGSPNNKPTDPNPLLNSNPSGTNTTTPVEPNLVNAATNNIAGPPANSAEGEASTPNAPNGAANGHVRAFQ